MAPRRRVELACLNEPLKRISTGRFEQPMAHERPVGIHDHQRFRDEVGNAIHNLLRSNFVICCYRTRVLQCEAADEDRQATQYHALRFSQQPVAPVEHCAQSLMARQRCPPARCQKAEAIVQSRDKAFNAEYVDARRGKLDCQWDTIEAMGDPADQSKNACVRRERRRGGPCPFDKQANCAKA